MSDSNKTPKTSNTKDGRTRRTDVHSSRTRSNRTLTTHPSCQRRTIALSDRIRDLLCQLATLGHSKRREKTGYRSPFGIQLTVEVSVALTTRLLGRRQDLHLLYVRLREVTQNLAAVCTENIASGVFFVCSLYTAPAMWLSLNKRRENTGFGVCRGWHGCPCGLVKESNLSYRSIRCTYCPANLF